MARPQKLRRTRRTEVVAFGGGIDLQTPANSRQAGTLLDCRNFTVPPTGGGYERFKGLKKYDGRTVPGPPTGVNQFTNQCVKSVFTFGGDSYALAEKVDRSGLISYKSTDRGWENTRGEHSPDDTFCQGLRGMFNVTTSYPPDFTFKYPKDDVFQSLAITDWLKSYNRSTGEFDDGITTGGSVYFSKLMTAKRWKEWGNPYLFAYTYTRDPGVPFGDITWSNDTDSPIASPFRKSDGGWLNSPVENPDGSHTGHSITSIDEVAQLWSSDQWDWINQNENQMLPYGHLVNNNRIDRVNLNWRLGMEVSDPVDGVDVVDALIMKRTTRAGILPIPDWNLFSEDAFTVSARYFSFDDYLTFIQPDPKPTNSYFYDLNRFKRTVSGQEIPSMIFHSAFSYNYPFDFVPGWESRERVDGGLVCYEPIRYNIKDQFDDADGALLTYNRQWRISDEVFGTVEFNAIVGTRYESVGYDHSVLDDRRVQVAVGNFYGDLDRERAYVVTGVSRAHEFDGQEYVPIIVFGEDESTLDRPTHVAVHGLHLWLATKGGQLHYSQTGNPTKFGGATSGTIGVGDEITGLIGDYQGALIIFCRNKTFMLTGREEDDFELRQLSNNSGALPGSVQMGENPVCMDDRGVRLVTPTDTFGDLSLGTVSERIHPLIDMLRNEKIAASVVVRQMNQYWLIYENGEVLVMTWVVGQEGINVQWSRLNFKDMLGNDFITCAWSGEDRTGKEIVLLGASNGNVYQANVGNDLDGVPVNGYLVVVGKDMGQPNAKKRFYRIETDVVAQGNCSFRHGVHRNYGESFIPIGEPGIAGLYAQLNGFGQSTAVLRATDPGFPRAKWVSSVDGIGIARNIDYVITTGQDNDAPRDPFTVTGMSVDWSLLRSEFGSGRE